MKILVTTSSPDTDIAPIQAQLVQAGLQNAIASNGLTPSDWHTKLYRALDLGPAHQARAPLTIGKAWQDLAVGLHLANIDQTEWGFAEPLATWTLDFWKNLDPQCRFVLVYTPAQHLELSEPEQQQTWVRFNTELLRFYKANKNKAILVNLLDAQAHPHRLAHTCQKLLGLQQLNWQALATPAVASTHAKHTQWRNAMSVLSLVPAHIARLQAVPAASRPQWLQVVQQLAELFAQQSQHLRYDQAEAISVSSPAKGQETMRLALRNVEMGNYRNPLIVLDLGLQQKTTRGKAKTTHVHFDFRKWEKAAAPFANWQPSHQDEQGDYMRISIDLAKQRISQDTYDLLNDADKAVFVGLVQALTVTVEELNLDRFAMAFSSDTWSEAFLQATTFLEFELNVMQEVQVS